VWAQAVEGGEAEAGGGQLQADVQDQAQLIGETKCNTSIESVSDYFTPSRA
jgi:hypothetical protein